MSITKQYQKNLLRLAIFILSAFLVTFFFTNKVFAKTDYSTTIISMSGSGKITMEPEEVKEIRVEFLNTGTQTWTNYDNRYLSVYTYVPKYRKSVFDPGTWIWGDHTAVINERSVAPGEKASVNFKLRAPKELGSYEETFKLAAEDIAWVDGGQFTLKIEVKNIEKILKSQDIETSEKNTSKVDSGGYKADLVVRTANKIKIKAGKTILFTAGFKNTGSKVWNNYSLNKPDIAIASNGGGGFTHSSWNGSRLAYVDKTVKPGEMAIVSFAFTAPKTNGIHVAKFQLSANNVTVPDAFIEIPVEVTGGSAEIVKAPLKDTIPVKALDLIPEPNIRVGVLIVDEETDNKVIITSNESDYWIKDINGKAITEMQKGRNVVAFYKEGKYFFDAGRGLEKSEYGLRFEPNKKNAVMTIVNFDKRKTRGSHFAENEFRNVLELRHNDYKNRAWIINELPLDYYLRGLGETPESYPLDANKAQATAARTYAFFHILRNGKRAKEFMDLNSTPSDQVYLGYGKEKRAPKMTRAVIETAGQIVTVDSKAVITPYYARSNGSTKDWSSVWWGTQEHLKAKKVPCDVGKKEWGHGVGMPQSGAKCLGEEGKGWKEILQYFYTGVDILRQW